MKTGLILQVAARVEVGLRPSNSATALMQDLLAAGEADADVYLDIVDAVLAGSNTQHVTLERTLQAGRSVWAVAADGRSLQERVDPAARMAADLATKPADLASEELSQAWSKAFGREPDPSDAWDHAIKAVEAILIPVVVPKQDKAHLGHVLGALDRHGDLFELLLGESDTIRTLVSMLRLLWPNPDRHASPTDRREPSGKEARAVVSLTITIVQWTRDGLLRRV